MKHIYLLAFIICSVNCFSQDPNPELFQIWYLSSVTTYDSSPGYGVRYIEPAIAPTLSISTSPAKPVFTGTGACNTFNGAFISFFPGQLQTVGFTRTTSVCSSEIHNSFEAAYFGVLQNASQYQIAHISTGAVFLIIFNPTFGDAMFQNFPLSTTGFDIENIAIYPNPGNSLISLNSNQAEILKVDVINSYGQIVKTINDNFGSINVSDLSSGIYILKINSVLGTINKKFIKE